MSSSNGNGNQPKLAGRFGHGRQGDTSIEGSVSWNIRGFFVSRSSSGWWVVGKSDGAIINVRGSKEFIEVKGCRCKKGKNFTVTLKDIRLDGTNFKHLFGVARKRDPSDWTDVDEYGQCDFWLAHVTRENLIKAMQESGRSHMRKVDATITPGSTRSWLGKYVKWIHFEDLTIDWWMKDVMASRTSC